MSASRFSSSLTPEQEDRALFKTYGGPIAVELVPQVNHTSASDFLVRGFFNSDTEISVLFPGRRAKDARALESHLRWLDNRVRHAAAKAQSSVPPIDRIRMSVQIKGSWRQNFWRNADGEETGVYQLVAARWAYTDRAGELAQFGEAPAFDTTTRARPKSHILGMREIDAVPQMVREASPESDVS